GCNTGLGQGMAVGLASAGCDIVGVNQSEPAETKQKIEELGRKFIDVRADLSKTDDIPNIVDRAVTELGRIDVLVNNAGIIRRNDAIDFSEQDWD
ncbi:SDR family NAD(P)-dependent oxidoreductase, partial [Vibrio breoganii]